MNKGFTFVETLVAIAVLLLAVAAPLSLASQGLQAARAAQNQVTALYLAQEAVEYARYTRDSNILSSRSWLSGLSTCATGSCTFDVPQGAVAACSGLACPVLRKNATSNLYGYTASWDATPFTRTITLAETVANQEVALGVTVSWRDGPIAHSVSLTEDLLNWQ